MGSIFVAGHRGLVGSAICHRLQEESEAVVTASRDQLDLKSRSAVDAFFAENDIEQVYLAAAKVGGIYANDAYPAEFIYDNLTIQTNVIDAAWRAGVKKLLFLGSSCIYPKQAPQPMTEDSLLTGPLEPTNEWYAIAKIAGIKMCQAYRKQYGFDAVSVMPTNLYGPGDNFDLKTSHVLPALIRKFHEAKAAGDKSVTVWGTGTPRREFLHVDDLASWRNSCRTLSAMRETSNSILPSPTAHRASSSIRPACRHSAGSRLSVSRRAFAVRTTGTYRMCIDSRLHDAIDGRD
jgi:GDP-L-fucose synthase